jgi:hypothetical protein
MPGNIPVNWNPLLFIVFDNRPVIGGSGMPGLTR